MTDFNQAIKWLKEGKKVRRPSWNINSYWKLSVDDKIGWVDGTTAHVHLNQINAKDWEIYCEKHDWEEHGCNAHIKEYYICRNCEKEKKIYEDEYLKTLKDLGGNLRIEEYGITIKDMITKEGVKGEIIKWIKEIQKAQDKIEEDYNKKPVSPACSGDITIGGCEFSWALPDYEDFSSAIKILKHVHNITEEELK